MLKVKICSHTHCHPTAYLIAFQRLFLKIHVCNFRIEYFDDMATTADGSSVDTWEPVAFSQKNIHIEGVQIFYDEISSVVGTSKGPGRERSESTASSQVSHVNIFGPPQFQSCINKEKISEKGNHSS